jgi:hypothetical protein
MPKIKYKHCRFSTDSLQLIEHANSIIDDYEKQDLFLTLRQLYYRFIGSNLFPDSWIKEWPRGSGVRTKNCQPNYDNLGNLIVRARLAGLIDWERIEDRGRNYESNSHWNTPREMIQSATEWYARNKWEDQPTYVEVWVEKDALFGVIDQICDTLDVGRFSCRGYTSSSEMWRAAMRHMQQMQNHGKEKCIVIHLSDHDPSGVNMTDDIIKRFKLFCRKHGFKPPTVERLALTLKQVRRYNPPPSPAKQTDSRYQSYVDKFEITDCWELDALEPNVLRNLIRRAVLRHRDDTLWENAVELEEDQRALLEKAHDSWPKIEKGLRKRPKK